MLIETRMTRRPQVAGSRDDPAASSSAPLAWADTLAMLARSHRIRIAASDPSRPWLSVVPPARGRPRT